MMKCIQRRAFQRDRVVGVRRMAALPSTKTATRNTAATKGWARGWPEKEVLIAVGAAERWLAPTEGRTGQRWRSKQVCVEGERELRRGTCCRPDLSVCE